VCGAALFDSPQGGTSPCRGLAHKHGCGKRGKNLKISAKKVVFLVSRNENLISPLLAPPLEELLEKSISAP